MEVLILWRLLWVLATVGASLGGNEFEYEGNDLNNYNNQISEPEQDGNSPTTPCQADLSRWDKLFIFLENSQMRQNMLLEAVEQCCAAGMVSLKNQVDKLAKDQQQCAPSPVNQALLEIQEDATERERRLDATLHLLLRNRQEENARLKRLEEGLMSFSPERQPTPKPGVLGRKSPLDEKAQIFITSELQKLRLQLDRVLDQTGAAKKDRGDTLTVNR